MNEKSITSKLLSKRAVRELLRTDGWNLDTSATERLHRMTNGLSFKAYVHEDGRGLYITGDGKGKAYASKVNMYAYIDHLEQMFQSPRQSLHILKGRLPYGAEFAQHIPEMVAQLATELRLQPESLDRTLASLKIVEAALKRTRRAKRLEQSLFGPLVAYIGEVMRIYVKGHWEMRLSSQDQETWEPWIVDSEERECNSWSYLYDMLVDKPPLSLSSVASIGINTRRYPPPATPPAGTAVHARLVRRDEDS